MNARHLQCILLICLLFAGCNPPPPPVPPPTPPVGQLLTPVPFETATSIPEITSTAQLPLAVVREDALCYFGNNGELTITISRLVIVGILARNSNDNWVQVRLNEPIDCWVELSSLELNGLSMDSVPVIPGPPFVAIAIAPTIAPSLTPLPTSVVIAPARLEIRWEILGYDCLHGRATGATIGLEVVGGMPEYDFSPQVPLYAQTNQFVSITVESQTADGEPSGKIEFTVPEGNDSNFFTCEKSGNRPGPELPPKDPPPAGQNPLAPGDPNPPPTQPPVCYNHKGKVVKCH